MRNSVRLSLRPSVTSRYRFKPKWDRDSGFLPYDSVESLLCYERISCRHVRRFPSNEGIKEGYPLRNRYFTASSSSIAWERLQTDADLLLTYKLCWRAFRGYQRRWLWTSLKSKNSGFLVNFSRFQVATHILRVNCAEITLNRCCRASHEH